MNIFNKETKTLLSAFWHCFKWLLVTRTQKQRITHTRTHTITHTVSVSEGWNWVVSVKRLCVKNNREREDERGWHITVKHFQTFSFPLLNSLSSVVILWVWKLFSKLQLAWHCKTHPLPPSCQPAVIGCRVSSDIIISLFSYPLCFSPLFHLSHHHGDRTGSIML